MDGNTPLNEVTNYARKLPVVRALLKRGADPNARSMLGDAPLRYHFDMEIAQCLIDGGADVNDTNNEGKTSFETLNFYVPYGDENSLRLKNKWRR